MSEKMKVLIAYDGSSCADFALSDLQYAGLPQEVEALILSVAEVFLPPPSPTPALPPQVPPAVQRAWTQATHAVDEAYTLAQQARTRLLQSFPAWEVGAEACADSPAWAVIKKAETWQPALIVVGSHGRSALGRFVLGSVSQKILTEARCSVRVARQRRQTARDPLHLLMGIDGSPDAAAAVQAVAARAWPVASTVRLVTALDARMSTALAFKRLPQETGTVARDAETSVSIAQTVEPLAELLRSRGLSVASVMKEGDPKQVLLDEAEQWEADCIFVGARGLRRVERFLLGSVSAAVAARARCSVEVVRPVLSGVGYWRGVGRQPLPLKCDNLREGERQGHEPAAEVPEGSQQSNGTVWGLGLWQGFVATRWRRRQADGKGGSRLRSAFHIDRPLVRACDLLRNSETYAQPGGMMRNIGRGPHLEDTRQISRVDAGTPIGHPHRAVRGLPGDVHMDLPSRRTKPDGVVQQREDHPLHLVEITAREHRLGPLGDQGNRARRRLRAHRVQGTAHDLPQIDGHAL